MTATVKIYITKTRKSNNFQENLKMVDMKNKELYGEIFYSYQIDRAIDENFLCEYEIVFPLFAEVKELNDIDSQLSKEIKDSINHLLGDKYIKNNKENFLIEKIKNKLHLNYIARMVGIQKILKEYQSKSALAFVNGISVNRAQHASSFMEAILKSLNDTHKYDSSLKTDYIEGLMSPSEREEKLNKLKNEKPFLLWNCRCLTEGVDIPECDAIVFFEPKQSFIDLIQAMGRTLRKDPNNENKKAVIIFPLEFDDKYKSSIMFLNRINVFIV
ncbi:DEAD/DEAH box helicase [Candidatus Phytoplasma luffae]|uniref:DEAD/DEAH box helicase n=1 Tax=Loofah witches'-broom phytoplasma TaxID=35773 RepID=A0A975ING3_LOWBP|nr:helicase-related protein [Candidatus Phytoplasma luffae]QTX02826.1 DEAD/DEAH box helicase [Candidatus Phytoplasma luffae]